VSLSATRDIIADMQTLASAKFNIR